MPVAAWATGAVRDGASRRSRNATVSAQLARPAGVSSTPHECPPGGARNSRYVYTPAVSFPAARIESRRTWFSAMNTSSSLSAVCTSVGVRSARACADGERAT